jgi:hypothetical protein
MNTWIKFIFKFINFNNTLQHIHYVGAWYKNILKFVLIIIGNNLKKSKKWKLQGSWNGTIVLTNKKITKVVCFKWYNHKTMACNN